MAVAVALPWPWAWSGNGRGLEPGNWAIGLRLEPGNKKLLSPCGGRSFFVVPNLEARPRKGRAYRDYFGR